MSTSPIFWMVVKLKGGGYIGSSDTPTKQHPALMDAVNEARRLAMQHPTATGGFAVLRGECIIKPEVSLTMLNCKGKTSK